MSSKTKESLNIIKGRYESEVTRALITYLHSRIDELRQLNDTAIGEDILKNQGSIRELNQFLTDLKRKPVSPQEDGAYR